MLRSNANLLRKLQNHRFTNIIASRCQHSASASNEETNTSVSDAKFQTNTNISTKYQKKLPNRAPLLKNFLVGVADRELLAFPEVIPREDMSKLHDDTLGIKNYFSTFNSDGIVQSKPLPAGIQDELKHLGLYGVNVSQHLGGKGQFLSESLITSEYEQTNVDIALALSSHRAIIDLLNELGTEIQMDKYLPKLANGSYIATEAIFEEKVSPTEIFNSTALYDMDDNYWNLNGEKSYVVNAQNANLFFVIAQTNRLNVPTTSGMATTAFLVDSTMPGVKVEGDKVTFSNVKLYQDNVIGANYDGNDVAEVLLKYNRLRSSLVALGMTKNVINYLTAYCINNKQCGHSLSDMNILRDRLSTLVTSAYSMESMIYYTAGLHDEFEMQDIKLESAATKYFAITHMWKAACASMEFFGPKTLTNGELSESFVRNAGQLYTQGEAMDSLRMYIALSGLQHAGNATNDIIKKGRNPLFHPNFVFSKFLKLSNLENPKVKLQLGEHLHPTLEPAAQCIEQSIGRIEMCVELLLTRYGSEIVEKQVEITRISDMLTTAYAMYTCISRASRSYCVGIRLADHELLLASSICLEGRAKIKMLASELFDGPYMTADNNLQRLSKQTFKSRGYFSEHPLTYNY